MGNRATWLVIMAVLAVGACRKGPAAEGTFTAGESTSRHGLSAVALVAAKQLRQFIGEKLVQSQDEATYDANVAEARRQLSGLRSKNKTESDRKVTLLLALLMAKDNERIRIVFLTRKGLDFDSVRGEISSLYETRERCDAELLGWLEYTPAERSTLESGPCLAEAQQAAALLGL